MSIGIFGESYACVGALSENPQSSWTCLLGESTDVFAKGGISLLWVYNSFLDNYTKYDKIIFVVPSFTRADHYSEINSYEVAEKMLNDRSISQEKYDRAKIFYDYYKHIQNDEVDGMYATLMIDSVKRLRPDTIFIPANDYLSSYGNVKVTRCHEFVLLQTKSLFPNQPRFNIWSYYTEKKTVNHHFTDEINILFAAYVRRALNGEGWQDWGINNLAPVPHKKPWDYYYERSKK